MKIIQRQLVDNIAVLSFNQPSQDIKFDQDEDNQLLKNLIIATNTLIDFQHSDNSNHDHYVSFTMNDPETDTEVVKTLALILRSEVGGMLFNVEVHSLHDGIEAGIITKVKVDDMNAFIKDLLDISSETTRLGSMYYSYLQKFKLLLSSQ
jgi:hypothetical protein